MMTLLSFTSWVGFYFVLALILSHQKVSLFKSLIWGERDGGVNNSTESLNIAKWNLSDFSRKLSSWIIPKLLIHESCSFQQSSISSSIGSVIVSFLPSLFPVSLAVSFPFPSQLIIYLQRISRISLIFNKSNETW